MIPKPSYLTGEAKPFEEIFDGKYIHTTQDAVLFCKEFKDCYAFYLQPFTPDMITEYFEGWEKVDDDMGTYWENNKQLIEIDEYDYCLNENRMGIDHPLTLQHFISDCVRAGINLKWRES